VTPTNGRLAATDKVSTNGHSRYQQGKVRVAIIGVGNCASSLVQGVQYYKSARANSQVPGLMHVDLGGYHIRDIEFSAAFDIDADKVGKDLSEAIFAGQNNTIQFCEDVATLNVPVQRGMTHDGLGKYLKQRITKAPGETVDIVQVLKDTRTDVVVSYLPVGSEDATKWYVEQILEAGVGFVNCIPVFIAREDYWNKRFKKAGLPIIGDDIKSQVGATIVHRSLARLFHDRGVKLLRTSQLNVGGNMDFFNMLERERLESKKISKTNAVTSIVGHDLPADDVHVGPSDYVPWLTDRKWAHIRLEGQTFGDVPLTIETKLEVWDSPNSAGIVIDAVRLIKLALNNGISGQLDGPSSYLMNSPYNQRPDDEARKLTETFIAKNSRKTAVAVTTAASARGVAGKDAPARKPAAKRAAAKATTAAATTATATATRATLATKTAATKRAKPAAAKTAAKTTN
jgi:myo-inositol-1-phosphate synthase